MKAQGNIAELKFMSLAVEQGITVSLPFGDNAKYGCITDKTKLLRVQIKSTSRHETSNGADTYNALVSYGTTSKSKYTSADCDIIAIYVIPHNAWYIIPITEIVGKTVKLYPHKPNSNNKYEKWLKRWDLL